MARGGAHFSSSELAQALSYYDIGVIDEIKSLSAGNRRAPKVVVTSANGKFLLKRRARGKDDVYRVAFSHAIQQYLWDKGFAVTELVPTKEEGNTLLELDSHIYECFKFVEGTRYDGSLEVTVDTGRQLGRFHSYLCDFCYDWKPPRGSFHDSPMVRRQLKVVGADKQSNGGNSFAKAVEKLMSLYNKSSARVNQEGFDCWAEQVVHGDWHPGNMLFKGGALAAVFDFDSVRIACPLTDLANGMLQFSIVGGRPNPADWPAYSDEKKILQFFEGYDEVIGLEEAKINSLVDLMIETIIAEAVLPVAATGFFGNLSGVDFLKMISRKAEWLEQNRKKITRRMKTKG